MLLDDFFYIDSFVREDQTVRASLRFDPAHQIFTGHFPGQPVVPGVCMMQITKELLEQAIGKKTRLLRAGQVKFLALINPLTVFKVEAVLLMGTGESSDISVDARFFDPATVYFKYKAVFKRAP